MKTKIIIGLNSAWNLYNFRAGLIRSLVAQDYEVITFAPYDNYATKLDDLGCSYYDIKMDNRGKSLINDFLLFIRLLFLFIKEKPNIYLGFTIKPNIYGSLVSQILGIKYVNNIAGLGSSFSKNNFFNIMIQYLYRFALYDSYKVIFQNDEDKNLFLKKSITSMRKADLVPGSGVNLKFFSIMPFTPKRKIRFLLASRIIREKGVEFFVKAAEIVKKQNNNTEFLLLGFIDDSVKGEITKNDIESWELSGSVVYLGASSDVRHEMAKADCIVLPTFYREGTPKVLLEAAALGRPIITTDSIGSRNVVDDELNGFLCYPKDEYDLAAKMLKMSFLSPEVRKSMGLHGRNKVEKEFDERFVLKKYSDILKRIINT